MQAAWRGDAFASGSENENEDEEYVFSDESVASANSVASSRRSSLLSVATTSRYSFRESGSRRTRGSRGGSAARHRAADEKPKYRGGGIPQAPEFSGDVYRDGKCLKRWKRRVDIWLKITSELCPRKEAMMRLLERFSGDAAEEIEDTPVDKYYCDDGLEKLYADL